MSNLVFGNKLTFQDQQNVLNAYPCRMTHETIARYPEIAEYMREGGYRALIISDQEWLKATQFRVRKNGRLDKRVTHANWYQWINGAFTIETATGRKVRAFTDKEGGIEAARRWAKEMNDW